MNRRGFLKTVAAASPLILTSPAFGQNAVSPNETVNIGVVGLGGRARQLRESVNLTDGIRIVAVSDCFQPRIDQWMESNPEGQECTPYLDFREMIEKENLDGIMAVTTTHARAWVSCHAMAMGCDVYIEKPMSLTIAEGREMVDCARKYGSVTQIGTQQRSIPLNNWAASLVRNGRIGKLRTVYAPNFLGPVAWPTDRPEEPFPEGSNEGWWDVWTNQAPLRPYHHLMHRQWDHYAEFDGGGQSFGVTGWGAHSYDEAQKGMGTDESGPIEIILEEPLRDKLAGIYPEGREISPNETGAHYYQMIQNRAPGPRAVVRMKYAEGHDLALTLDADWGPGLGAIFVGDDGIIEINRDVISASDPEIISGDDPRTVASVAREAGIRHEGPGYDARELPDDEAELDAVMAEHRVFGRVTPEQKKAMVLSLQRLGHTVAMTGDGVNDALALKHADMGIAMGSGAAATRAVARLVLLDGQFSRLPRIVAEGRQVIANVERLAKLFLSKTTYAVLFAIVFGLLLWPFPFLPRQLSIVDGLTIGLPALVLALLPNIQRYRPGFLRRAARFCIPSGLIVGGTLISVVAYAYLGGHEAAVVQTAAVITLTFTALWVLVILSRPFTLITSLVVAAAYLGLPVLLLIPVVTDFLQLGAPPFELIAVAVGASIIGSVALEVMHRVVSRHGDDSAAAGAAARAARRE